MEWHNGNFMSHTVFTLLYTRHLDSIDPDTIQKPSLAPEDPHRPLELITIVLRASVAGLLKCCDLTWRELSKGAVQDVCWYLLFLFRFSHCDLLSSPH